MLTLALLELARPGNRVNFKGMIINLSDSNKQSRESEGKALNESFKKESFGLQKKLERKAQKL